MRAIYVLVTLQILGALTTIVAHLIARRRKCSTVQVVRETLTIQRGGGNGEER